MQFAIASGLSGGEAGDMDLADLNGLGMLRTLSGSQRRAKGRRVGNQQPVAGRDHDDAPLV